MKEVSEGGKYNGNWKSNREGNGRRGSGKVREGKGRRGSGKVREGGEGEER